MRQPKSRIMFEIVDGNLVYRWWDVQGGHLKREIRPNVIVFGKTGIMLHLTKGELKLEVPEGQDAKLVESDEGFRDDRPATGKFVTVGIY